MYILTIFGDYYFRFPVTDMFILNGIFFMVKVPFKFTLGNCSRCFR